MLKANALQWWSSVAQSGRPPLTWVDFKTLFVSIWMTSSFEVDVITAWRNLSSQGLSNLDEYVKKFWTALHSLNSFRPVSLVKQVETFCCGLPKELRDYCIKNKVQNMTQMAAIAQTGYDMLTGKMSGFKFGGSSVKAEDNKKKEECWKVQTQRKRGISEIQALSYC